MWTGCTDRLRTSILGSRAAYLTYVSHQDITVSAPILDRHQRLHHRGSWISWIIMRGSGEPRERRTGRLTEHCSIADVCLGSLRASRGRLNGQNPAAESGLCRQCRRLEPSAVLFKKNGLKPENAHSPPFLSLSVSPAANVILVRIITI